MPQSPEAPPEGRPIRVLHVIDGLDVGGAQSVLLAILALADPARFRFDVANVGGALHPGLAEKVRASSAELAPARGRALWDVRSLAALVAAIRRRRIDVVHTHLAGADVLGGLAARITGRRAVSTLHSVAAWRHTYRRERRVLADFALRRLVARILAVSREVKTTHVDALDIPADRIDVVPNVPLAPLLVGEAFDRERKRRELGVGGEALVCTTSRLTDERDHESLVRAFPRVLERQDAVALVVGDGPRRRALEALAADLGVAERVRFLGTRLDAAEIVAAADVFCQPTLLEGLPVAVLDAMSLGVPVVLSDVPGMGAVADGGALAVLVPPRDHAALADALADLVADRERARALADRARAAVERDYDAREWIRTIENVYVELARG